MHAIVVTGIAENAVAYSAAISREREARARGDEFRRYTYGDVLEDPRYVLAELRELLLRRRPA